MNNRDKKIKMGLLHGSFDMLEVRDIDAINIAKEECEELIVAVYSDEMYEKLKGIRPEFSSEKRKQLIEAVRGVDYAIIIDEQQQLYDKDRKKELIELIRKEKTKKGQKNNDDGTKKQYENGCIQAAMDMFHYGHLNLINNAKKYCKKLTVAVNSDDLIQRYKNKTPIVSCEDRMRIIGAIKGVDRVVSIDHRDKVRAAKELQFDALLMGDDWKNTSFYNEQEEKLRAIGVTIVYLPRTPNVSSTNIREEYICRKGISQEEK